MLKGYIDAYRSFGNYLFLERAKTLASFMTEKMYTRDNYLVHCTVGGKVSSLGYLDDYSYTIEALTGLYQATFDENDNSVASTGINNTIVQGAGLLNLIPTAELSVNSSSELEWFDETRYPGAFDPNLECTWLDGWSMLSEREFISCDASNIDEAIKSEFSIFPNPTNGEFSITFESEAQNASVNIIDLNGKLVYNNTRNVSAGEIVNISLLNLPEGMYLVNILSDNQTQYSKLIIE